MMVRQQFGLIQKTESDISRNTNLEVTKNIITPDRPKGFSGVLSYNRNNLQIIE